MYGVQDAQAPYKRCAVAMINCTSDGPYISMVEVLQSILYPKKLRDGANCTHHPDGCFYSIIKLFTTHGTLEPLPYLKEYITDH